MSDYHSTAIIEGQPVKYLTSNWFIVFKTQLKITPFELPPVSKTSQTAGKYYLFYLSFFFFASTPTVGVVWSFQHRVPSKAKAPVEMIFLRAEKNPVNVQHVFSLSSVEKLLFQLKKKKKSSFKTSTNKCSFSEQTESCSCIRKWTVFKNHNI